MRIAWILCLISLVGLGCEDECLTRTCGDIPDGGIIEGHIDAGGLPCEFDIVAYRLDDQPSPRFQAFDYADSSGDYHLSLPYGDYRLEMECGSRSEHGSLSSRAHFHFSEMGAVLRAAEADTITVSADQTYHRMDMTLGALRVILSIPEELEGQTLSLLPELLGVEIPPTHYYHWRSASAEGQHGQAIFSMPAFFPGECQLELLVGHYERLERFWLPSGRTVAQAEVVTILPGETTTYEVTLASHPAFLAGAITGSWQAMSADNPKVTLLDADSSFVATTLVESNDGDYSFTLYDPTPVKVLIDIEGSQHWYGGRNFSDAQIFDLQRGTAIADVDLVECGIQFELMTPTYQSSQCDFTISLYESINFAPVTAVSYTCSSQGPYVCFPNLQPGSYVAHIENTYLRLDWISQWIDRAATPDGATVITLLAPGEAVQVTVLLEKGATISGYVHAPGEDPCPAAVIYVVDAATEECIGRAGCIAQCCGGCLCINPDPYAARGLPDGDYKIGAAIEERSFDPPEMTYWYSGTLDIEAAEIVTISNTEALSGIDIYIPE